MDIIFARLPHTYAQRGPPLHTIFPPSAYALTRTPFSHEPALAAQHAGADLGTSSVPQVVLVDLEAHVVIRVHHLMRQRIFELAARPQHVCA